MSGQDDKFAILDRADSCYNILKVISNGYDLKSVFPLTLMVAYANYERGQRNIQGSDALIDALTENWREIESDEDGMNGLGELAHALITMSESGLYFLEERLLDLESACRSGGKECRKA